MTQDAFPPSKHSALSRRQALLLPAALASAAAPWDAAAQADEVDLLLVLAIDASGSIDVDEFRLQREGCAGALVHPAVLSAIASRPKGAIGVALVEWPDRLGPLRPGDALTISLHPAAGEARLAELSGWPDRSDLLARTAR